MATLGGSVNADAIANCLANEIRSQESLHSALLKDLCKLAASPSVTETEFHTTFLRALGRSGLETRLQNAVFHLLRTKGPEQWFASTNQTKRKEPLSYMIKIQSQWERRIMKSLNSMCSELGMSLGRRFDIFNIDIGAEIIMPFRPRCKEEQEEIVSKWTELSNLDIDLSLFRPVYAPKDFLEILSQVSNPNLAENSLGKPWGLINVPLTTLSLNQLREKFSELSRAEPHLGVNPKMASMEDPTITLEMERYNLGQKVILANHAPLSQEFLKRGSPHSLRGKLWAQVLGSDVGEKEVAYHKKLVDAVVQNDIMVDKLILKDVQLTAANDDNYFVFEDVVLQVLLTFSRDTAILQRFKGSCSNPARATLRGKTASLENTVIYPPNGVIPFHGFAMYCVPFCYVYDDPRQLFYSFRAFYLQFSSKLHEVSSDQQGIVSLCALFEQLLQTYEPDLWTHFLAHDIQPLRLVFRWIMRAFSGHLAPEQLLFLWDLILAYDSMEVLPLLAASIISFRKDNLMLVDNLQSFEAVLADLSSLLVMPLLQLALERPAGPFRSTK